MVHKFKGCYPYKMRGHRDTQRRQPFKDLGRYQESCHHKAKNVSNHQKLNEASKDSLLELFKRAWSWFWTSNLQNGDTLLL